MIEKVYTFFLQTLHNSSLGETVSFNGRLYVTWNYQIMDYFFDQERPDVAVFIVHVVVVFIFYDMMIMLTINLSILYKDKTTSKPTFYTNKVIKHLRRRVNLCVHYHLAVRRNC
jgi:hypothetical protein